MGDVRSAEVVSGSATVAALQSAARVADNVEAGIVSPNFIKGVLGATSFSSLVFGIRSAWKHTKQPEATELARAQLFSGVGFASRALLLSTVITVSGFSLFVVGVSWALNVNTPRQFGASMKNVFGDTLRLPQSKTSQSFEDLINGIEARKSSTPVEEPNKSV